MRRLFKSDAVQGQDAPQREGAGDVLRAAREAQGWALPDVASMLRIRLPYLQAIEDGRYGDLPGSAYASGFLRSYAEHLGLNPEEVVLLYKREAMGSDARRELYLPTPAAEGRMPGGALLFGALVLAGAVYGGWYYLSATDRSIVDVTPALPDRLVALMEGLPWRSQDGGDAAVDAGLASVAVPAPAAPPAAPPVSAPAAPAPAPAVSAPAVSAPAAAPPRNGTGFAVSAAPAAPAAPTPAASAAATSSAPAAAVPSAAAQPPAVAPAAAAPAEPEEENEGSGQEPTPLGPNAGALSAAVETPPVELPPATGKVYGGQNVGSRIQLRATQETWLQVRDRSGEFLLTRTLKPGDVYHAPDRPGLRVRTGNAGGLVVITDGVAGQPMGAVGQVLRDVPLEAPPLRSSTN